MKGEDICGFFFGLTAVLFVAGLVFFVITSCDNTAITANQRNRLHTLTIKYKSNDEYRSALTKSLKDNKITQFECRGIHNIVRRLEQTEDYIDIKNELKD